MATLSVEFRAKIQRLERELKKARQDLAKTGDVAESTAGKVQRTGTKAGKGLRNLGKGAANATPTLQEFSRVIQDAPFGIQGVGNNITQLTGNFGNLAKSAGGTTAALRLLLGSLAGPAGILFAVSTAVSLLTVFGDKLFTSKNKAKELADELERINDASNATRGLAESELELLELQGEATREKKQQIIAIIGAQAANLTAIQEQNKALLTQIQLQNEIVSDWELITQAVGKVASAAAVLLVGAYETSKKVLDSLREPLEDLFGIEVDRSKFASSTAESRQKEQELTNKVNEGQAAINKLLADALRLNQGITKEREKQAAAQSRPTASGATNVLT